MKTLFALLAIALSQLCCSASDSYSMEATVTRLRDANQYEAVCRIFRLVDRKGSQTEELLTKPRIVSTLGQVGSFYVGPDRTSSSFHKMENFTMEVVWPEAGQTGFAVCTFIVKRGDKVLAKSKMQVMVDGNRE